MGKVDFRKMDAAAEELQEEAKRLRSVQLALEELYSKTEPEAPGESGPSGREKDSGRDAGSGKKTEDRVADARSVRETEKLLAMLGTEVHALEKAALSLRSAAQIYRQAEARVLAIYDGEIFVAPRTRFGTSHFENLRDYERLIPVHAGMPSAQDGGQYSAPGGGSPDEADRGNPQMKSLEGIL